MSASRAGVVSPGSREAPDRRLGATATTKIRRSDFWMSFIAVLDTGGVLVGDEVSITLDIQLIKQAT
ncbi:MULTISPECIES: YceI family protein [Sorangium]|uniref:Lipid/polyisoprenoid-binding YceI-like domain-containing protein n=1 Tax=Sorangium cellulosum TaxID=56 RepID=A0A4P2QGI3_SORCE|nr:MULTISPECIES: YceI family protein [Sorangium]AUX28974.1 uncharacterized protein SOCE836_010590 [Sorangium cellulosum]WCQ88368.1 hypothetical protein NQZ70_01044 [Sorangium sp. Soce836]